MPADLMLLVTFALKIALTVSITVAASVLVERSGPFLGAMIASLPTAGGAAMIILALEHPPEFVAASAVGSLVSGVACAVYALMFAALARRHGLVLSLAIALAVWLAFAAVAQAVQWTIWSAIALNVVLFPATIFVGSRLRGASIAGAKLVLTTRDIAWRTAIVTAVVIAVTTLSHWIGSFASGMFAFFPVAMSSFLIILHSRVGAASASSFAAHVQAPLVGLGLSLCVVYWLAQPLGVWTAYVLALATGIAWNAGLWLLRRWQTSRA